MSAFSVHKNEGEDTYHIECLFVVYRAKFGHHPSFCPQNEEDGARDGYNTKYWFLVYDGLSKELAETRLADYQFLYEKLIHEIEDNDELWDEFPFKNCPVVYYK